MMSNIRLSYRIMNSSRLLIPNGEVDVQLIDEYVNIDRQLLKDVTIIRADNVADYCLNLEKDITISDFPKPMIPLKSYMIEWQENDKHGNWYQFGFLGKTLGTEDPLEASVLYQLRRLFIDEKSQETWDKFEDDIRFVNVYSVYGSNNLKPLMGRAAYYGAFGVTAFDGKGEFLMTGWTTPGIISKEHSSRVLKKVVELLPIIYFTASFMNCNNVDAQEETNQYAHQAKKTKQGREPALIFKVLQIEPMKKVLRTEGNSDVEGLKRALHICRGHFATYSEDKPLFGRKAGTVWRHQHIRGNKEVGEVVKQYEVSPPK